MPSSIFAYRQVSFINLIYGRLKDQTDLKGNPILKSFYLCMLVAVYPRQRGTLRAARSFLKKDEK